MKKTKAKLVPKVVIIDNELEFRERLIVLLSKEKFKVIGINSFEKLDAIKNNDVDVVLLSHNVLSGLNNINLKDLFHDVEPLPEIILMLSPKDIHSAIYGMKKGVFDDIYIPFEISELKKKILRAYEARKKKVGKKNKITFKRKIEDLFVKATVAEANVNWEDKNKK